MTFAEASFLLEGLYREQKIQILRKSKSIEIAFSGKLPEDLKMNDSGEFISDSKLNLKNSKELKEDAKNIMAGLENIRKSENIKYNRIL